MTHALKSLRSFFGSPALPAALGLRATAMLPRTTMYTVHVDEDVLQDIVRRLVAAVDPDRIILFGSRARGDAKPDSDVDLLLIKASDEPPHRRIIKAHRGDRHSERYPLAHPRGDRQLVWGAQLRDDGGAPRGAAPL